MEQGSRAAVARERIREPGPGPEPRPRAPGRAAAVRGALHVLAPFPRSVPTFVGRSDELARAHGLLVRAPALLVYGVPGIGKSEFVYRLIDELREDPAWRRARPVLLQAQRGQSAASLVSLLRLALEGPRRSPLHPGAAPRPPAGSDGEGLSAQALAGLVHALELRPHLVFLDDAHHLEEGALLALLSYLSRRVSKSRILVASRAELPLSPEGPLPAVIRLPPLAAAETAALASQLVEQLGLEPLSGDVFGVTRGSPYHVQRVLMRSRGLPVSGEDPLLVTLRGLSPAARRLLLLCRILAGRMGELLGEGRTELPAIPELPELRAAQWELGRYFLVQAPRYTVHELVWEAVAPAFSPEDHAQAHRTAARLCLSRSAAGREPVHVPEPQPLDVLAALQHLLACGDGAAAWSIFVSSRRLLTAPSLEPLLLVVLAELQQSCPERAEDVVIFCAQRLLRQARIGEARARLVALQRERGGLLALGGQALRLLGHAAARAGELAAAAEPLDAACRARPDDPAVRLELAWIAALQGDHGFAACRLEEATALVVLPLERVRLARQRALCALLAERPAGPQLAAALALLPSLPAERRAEEEGELALIELALLCAEGDLPGARRALDRILFHGALMSGPPEPLQDLGRGALLLAEGAVPAAQLQLLRAHEALQERGDQLLVLVTELLLGACGLRSGADAEALGLLEEARRRAARTGARPLERLAEALRAQALLAGRELSAAGQVATAVLAAGDGSGDPAPAWARLVACGVKVQLAALHGDRAGAEQALSVQAQVAKELACPAAARRIALVRAELAAQLEPPAQALALTEAARACFRGSGQRYELARAELAHALACARHGGDGPLLACAESLEAVSELGAAGGYLPLLLGAALGEAALLQRRGESRRAAELLRRALDDSPAACAGVAALPLRAALDPSLRAPAGVRSLLTGLGLHAEPAIEVTDRRGARIVPAATPDARPSYDLIVDVDRGLLGTPDEAARLSGRPLLCLILARLLAARTSGGDSVDAERLFYDVWGGREYNPLRHRNTIYVAITRLRQALRDVLPGREVIETTPSGWRLAPGIELCVRRALK